MGQGIAAKCTKCRYKKEFDLGIGYLYPMLCQQAKEDMLAGSYGEDAKAFFETYPDGWVDEEVKLFQCEKCGKLEALPVHTLFAAKEGFPEEKKGQSWLLTRKELEEYCISITLDHYCKKCSGKMKEVKNAERKLYAGKIKCPCCGKALSAGSNIMWD